MLFTSSMRQALVRLQTPSIAQYLTVVLALDLVVINLFFQVFNTNGPARSKKITVPGGDATPSVLGWTFPSLYMLKRRFLTRHVVQDFEIIRVILSTLKMHLVAPTLAIVMSRPECSYCLLPGLCSGVNTFGY